jgi:hypothetical protein
VWLLHINQIVHFNGQYFAFDAADVTLLQRCSAALFNYYSTNKYMLIPQPIREKTTFFRRGSRKHMRILCVFTSNNLICIYLGLYGHMSPRPVLYYAELLKKN